MAEQVKAPEFPQELESNERRAARAIKSTVREAIKTMQEVAPIINRFRTGEAELVAKLESSETEQAVAWRRGKDNAAKYEAAAKAEYEAAIAPFKAEFDRKVKESADTLKNYFDEAVAAESPDDALPTQAEYTEAVEDWLASAAQLKLAERNAKQQLKVEFSIAVQNIQAKRESGGPAGWRPRFSEAQVNGKTLSDNPILTDVVAEISGATRDLFIGWMLTHLPQGRETWDAMEPGESLRFTTPELNKRTYSLVLTKAEPVKRGKNADGTDSTDDDTESDEESDD